MFIDNGSLALDAALYMKYCKSAYTKQKSGWRYKG